MNIIAVTYVANKHLKPANQFGKRWALHFVKTEEGKSLTVTGSMEDELIRPGLNILLQGKWDEYGGRKQFKFDHAMVMRPIGRRGTIAFLNHAPGIGKKIAEQLWNIFGNEAIEEIVSNTENAANEIDNLSIAVARNAGNYLSDKIGDARALGPLVTLFDGISLPKSLPSEILKMKWRNPVATVSENPFLLMDFPRMGFGRCDSIRIKLKLPADMETRKEAAVQHAFSATKDQLWIHKRDLSRMIADCLGMSPEAVMPIIRNMYRENLISYRSNYLAREEEASREVFIVNQIVPSLNDSDNKKWPKTTEYVFKNGRRVVSELQEAEIKKAFSGGCLALLLGGPGTGKTYCAAQIIRAFKGKVLACAPTGKAADRLNTVLRDQGIYAVRPTTTHRMLGASMTPRGWNFQIDGINNFLDADLLVVDEISMYDNFLLASLLRAVPAGTNILLVGDDGQLPPIGRGAFLRDLKQIYDSNPNYSCGILTETHRSDGTVAEICKQIKNGKVPSIRRISLPGILSKPSVQFVIAMKDKTILDTITQFIDRVQSGQLDIQRPIDLINDIQFIVAINDHSVVSRKDLNVFLQKKLNPLTAFDIACNKSLNKKFRVGDKIISLENHTLRTPGANGLSDKENSSMVMNGEQGRVVAVSEKKIEIVMHGKHKRLEVFTNSQCAIDLGYAVTCHKCQGSQYPIVFVSLGGGNRASRVMGREWLYTAISRHQNLGIVCGNTIDLMRAIRQSKIWERKTFFKEIFYEQLGERKHARGIQTTMEDGDRHEGEAAV